MKKIMLSAVIIAATVCAARAQEQKTNQQTGPQVVKETDQKSYEAKQAQDWQNLLKTELKLTEDQSTRIAIINKEFADKKDAIMKDATLTEDAKKDKKATLKKEREAKFNEILTPEQQEKYKQLVEAKMKVAPAPKQ